jgi:protein pelota
LKLIEEDLKRGVLKLQCETIDDLWVLYNVIREGDIVYAKTTREVKIGESGSTRIPVVLGVVVKKVEFQQFADKLRVSGVIIDGPEKLGVRGKHHTIAIGVGDTITIIKSKWENHELEYIKRFSTRKPRVLIVCVDYEEVCVALLLEQGFKYLLDYTNTLPSKAYSVDYESHLEAFTRHIVKSVLENSSRERVEVIVVAGPGEFKERVARALREVIEIPVYTDSTSSGGCSGVQEVLNRDVVKKVVGDFQLIKAREALNLFKELLIKDPEMVAYGLDDVLTACQLGAVKALVIVDDFLKSSSDEEFTKAQTLLRTAYETRSEIVIIPGSCDLGGEVRGFGGVIAILRFKVSR